MSLEDNKLLALRLYEDLYNRRRLALADELVAPECIHHAAPDPTPPGPAGRRQFVTALGAAFPDHRHVVMALVAEEDQVGAQLAFSGTHNGTFRGLAPTGRRCVQEQVHILRIADGRIVEWWAIADDLELLRQLRGS